MAPDRPWVLVVDDDPAIRRLLEKEIADLDLEVCAVADGEAAIEEMRSKQYPIAFVDIRLPGIDGIELTRWLREHYPETEVILITGYASLQTAIEGLRLGAMDYIVKPFDDLEAIHESLSNAIERLRCRMEQRVEEENLKAALSHLGRVLNALPVGILVVDRTAHVHQSNRAAQVTLHDGPGLRLDSKGVLMSNRPEEREVLHRLIADVCSKPRSQTAATTLSRGLGRERLRVLIARLPGPASESNPMAAVIVSHPERRNGSPDADILRGLYGLTPAESELAAQFVSGVTVKQACKNLNIALTTARTHLARIYTKTGVSRQADLMRLFLSGPALLAAGVRPLEPIKS